MNVNKEVNFEIARLLKEKGYSWECKDFYRKSKHDKAFHLTTGVEYDSTSCCIWDWNLNGGKSGMLSKVIPYPNDDTAIYYSAPTTSEVVMWLYENHGIWIYARPFSSGYFHGFIVDNSGEMKEAINTINFNSPTEAYETAIEYTLNNLI